jgi:hypothetical protein
MANDISSRTWFIDTAAASVIYQPQVYIKFIEVVGGAAASVVGNSMATIADRNSKSIISTLFQTVGPGEIQTFNLENWFEGLIVSALGAGPVTLRVHIK